MLSYIQLKQADADDDTYLKLRVLFGSTSYPYSVEQGQTITRYSDGSILKQIGPAFKYWYGNFRVNLQEDEGYATLANILTMMTSENPADHRLEMRIHNWTDEVDVTYDVTFVNNVADPLPQLPVVESSSGFCLVQFRLEER